VTTGSCDRAQGVSEHGRQDSAVGADVVHQDVEITQGGQQLLDLVGLIEVRDDPGDRRTWNLLPRDVKTTRRFRALGMLDHEHGALLDSRLEEIRRPLDSHTV
jgi:hypothetical protein